MHISKSTFSTLYFDITYKCNMHCNICYNSNLLEKVPDMSVEYFRKVFEMLPKSERPIVVRFLGGEPTLHPDLHKLIQIVNEFGHTVTVGTNGLRFAEQDFINEVESWKEPGIAKHNWMYKGGDYPFCVFFDMSGGTRHSRFYKELSSEKNYEPKIKGLENCRKIGIRSLGATAIIMRDFNEEVIPDLIEYAIENNLAAVHFRTMGREGKWLDTEPYTLEELKGIVRQHLPDLDEYPRLRGYEPPEGKQCFDCCYRFTPRKGMSIHLLEFDSDNALGCWKRGYVNNDFTVIPFFERIRKFG